ncbi:MAG TPA: SpoIIE family protein phosphatase [Coriobacteriia bacterium]|nr:SpoIIE family protein phosphatase [Coriobacteriia bacterium]
MRRRIAYRLAAIWLAVAVPLAVILAISYVDRYQTRVDLVEQQRIGYAHLSALAFQSLIDSASRSMRALGADPTLLGNPSRGGMRLARTVALFPASYIVLTDEAGKVLLASTRDMEGRDLSQLPSYRAALADPNGIGLEPSSVEGSGTPGFHIAQHIYDDNNQAAGYMFMRVDIARLDSEYPLEVPTGGISIIDSDGQVVFQNEDPAYALHRERWGDKYPFIRRALAGRVSPTRDFNFPNGEQRIGAFVPVEPYGWAAGSSVDSNFALGTFWRSVSFSMPITLAVVVLGFLVSLAMSSGIRRSLQDLADDAETIGGGDFTRPIRTDRADEIGAVARALEKAREDLQSYEQQNSQLFELEQEIAQLNASLVRLGAMMHSTLDFKDAIGQVLEDATRDFGCDAVGVNLRRNGVWVRLAVHGLPERFVGEVLTDEQNAVAVEAYRTRQPVIIANAESEEEMAPWFSQRYGIKSAIVVPLILRGQAFGVLFFLYRSKHHDFTGAQVDFATNLANIFALAYENARLYGAEHDVAETLQSALLSLPDNLTGIEHAERYKSSTDLARVGGDFYDLFALDSGVGITVGDMAGHGIEAAVLTSLVKSAVYARAIDCTCGPTEVLATVNRVLYDSSPTQVFATLFFAVLDPVTGRLVYTSAGHPTGAIVSTRGIRRLPATSPIIGAFESLEFVQAEELLAEDETLFLYTDGIIEARDAAGTFFGEARLFDLLEENGDLTPDEIATTVYSAIELHSGGKSRDDLAILVVKRSG